MQASVAVRLNWGTTLEPGPRQTTYPGSNSSRNVDHGILTQEPVTATEAFPTRKHSFDLVRISYPFCNVLDRPATAGGIFRRRFYE